MDILASESAASLSIRLFGPMQVLVQGQPLPHLRSRKALWLLALLTLRHGRPVQRDWLAGVLWPEVNQTQAFANLRPTLSQLRTALGSEGARLQSPNRQSLVLELHGADVDVVSFDTAIRSTTTADMEQAVTLYRGILLEGCVEEWVVQERERREQDCLRVLQKLATIAAETADYETSVRYWRRAVTADPLGEAARRGLIFALDQSGDTNAALQVYREFVSVLQSDDPRAVPGEETTALYRRLREQVRQKAASTSVSTKDETPVPQVSGYLPYALTELVGREDERLEVAERLRRSRLVTLTGPGGIGKTRLAVAVANEVVREYPEGVWLVGLESLPSNNSGSRNESNQSIIQQIAVVLGVKEIPRRPLLAGVTEHLKRKRLLIVLDNCEHLVEPCAEVVSTLLHECLGLRILATSRETLRVSGETVWTVPALAAPDPDHLPFTGSALARSLAGFDAIRLFVERAEATHKSFRLTGDNARDLALLCARLEGVPLALELAAARADVLTPEEILLQLDIRPLDALTSRYRDTASRHRNLRATLEWSYGLLSQEAQTFLAAMGVFRGGWTMEAAQAVCPDAAVLEMLTTLRNASLINTTDINGEGTWYTMLETVRQYAVERLNESGNADVTRRRHATWYADWLTRYAHAEQKSWDLVMTFEREYSNLTTALQQAFEVGDDELILRICSSLPVSWEDSGRSREGRDWLARAIRRVSRENSDINSGKLRSVLPLEYQIKLLEAQLSFQRTTGDWESAAVVGVRIYEIFQQAGQPVNGRTSLFHAAQLRMYSDLKGALALLEECLPLECAVSEDGRGNPMILARLSEVAWRVGQRERADVFIAQALAVCHGREDSDRYGYLAALLVAGWSALAVNDLAKAHHLFERAVVVARTVYPFLATPALWGMAVAARESGDLNREEALLGEAFEVAGSDPSISQMHYLRKERVEFLLARGDHNGAGTLIRETLTLLRGRAHSYRLFTYPLLLQLAEVQEADGWQQRQATLAARLLGAAGSVAIRLGLLAPNPAELRRSSRLQSGLTECLSLRQLATEKDLGSALDDEAALELALQLS